LIQKGIIHVSLCPRLVWQEKEKCPEVIKINLTVKQAIEITVHALREAE
jgi:hypothetical protein